MSLLTDAIDDLNKRIFQGHPLQEPLTAAKVIDEVFSNDLIKLVFNKR